MISTQVDILLLNCLHILPIHTTNLNINEPDSRIEEGGLNEQFDCVHGYVLQMLLKKFPGMIARRLGVRGDSK